MKKYQIIFPFALLALTSMDSHAETVCTIEGQKTTLGKISEKRLTNQENTLKTFENIHLCLEQNNDRRIVFLDVYWYLTKGLFSLPARQEFKDLKWYTKLLVGTAERYRMAFHQYEIGDFENMPQVWRLAFDSYTTKKQSRPLDLLLGMNSHITYDIAVTLVDIETDFSNSNHYEDFRSLNPYFTEITPALWDIVEFYENRNPRGKLHRKFKGAVVNKWIIYQRLNTWDRGEVLDQMKDNKLEFGQQLKQFDQEAVKRSKTFQREKFIIKSL
jgi:hypothetical protein